MTNDQIISEEQVQKALDYLRDSAAEIGELTKRARMSEHLVKHVLALEMKLHGGPVSAQEREARASQSYFAACQNDSVDAGELAKIRALREAAAMRLEIYRTQSSNWRSMKIS